MHERKNAFEGLNEVHEGSHEFEGLHELETVSRALFLAWQEMAERSEIIALTRAPLGLGELPTDFSA